MRMTNKVITLLNEGAYEQKESLVEDLMRVVLTRLTFKYIMKTKNLSKVILW